ncbi:PAS domain-containing sensor histidine kinase [Dactylosporangium sp. CA-152071]|uniref:PAS domain-containing sensor histidine kinase n=1 Tax=Dactylosporangium sp. CA-152071 TaxID=3239933 RepID=UPI003D9216AC
MLYSDADLRTLSAPDRWRRIAPFLTVAILACGTALFRPVVDRVALVSAVVVLALLLGLAVTVPWHRLPAIYEAAPPLGFFGVVALLNIPETGDDPAGYGALALLPVFWLALYHGRAATAIGVVAMAVVFSLPMLRSAAVFEHEWRRGLLVFAIGALMASAAQSWVRRSRAAAAELAARTREVSRERDFNRAILDSAGFLVMVLDTDGRITAFNRRCEEVTGFAADEVIGRPFWSAGMSADDTGRGDDAFAHLTADAFPNTFENDWLAADGSHHRIVWSNTALTDENELLTHVIGTGLDVTTQRHTERLFADVLAAATEQAIIGTDRRGTVTVFNAGAERLLGHRAADVVGAVTLDRFHLPAEVPGLATLFEPAQAGDSEPREWTYVRRDGATLPVSLTVSVIRGESGEVTGYLSVARDITRERRTVEAMRHALDRERAAAARLRELDKVRADLVATVSHELRTPLTSILGNVEVIVDGDAGPVQRPQARLLAAVERNARRLLALIEDLLMLSRIEAGQVKINAGPVHLRAVVSGALEALQSVRGQRDVHLDIDLPDPPIVVHGDRDQLERVLINLLDNALKFTPPGGSARLTADLDGAQVRLTVADTGIGIPPAELDQIFDRFFRSSRSQELQSQGTGLGLAITKSIVERHGGHIWAGPALDQGTIVTCLLPLHDAPVPARTV